MTPGTFLNFKTWSDTYGVDYAIRSLALENHTASELVRLLNEEKLGDAVDLVAGGHITMFMDESRLGVAKGDFEAAAQAGVNLSTVEWLSSREMESVRVGLIVCSGLINFDLCTEIWHPAPRRPISRAQLVASETRNAPLHSRPRKDPQVPA